MSSYLSFFIKPAGQEQLFPIADYSRSTSMYQFFNAPYGVVRDYSSNDLGSVIYSIEGHKREAIEQINHWKARKDLVAAMADVSLADKLEEIDGIEENIHESQQMIKEADAEIAELYFIANQICGNDNKLYAGVDVSEEPDIKE